MNFLKKLNNQVATKALPTSVGLPAISMVRPFGAGEITLYPQDGGERYISKGYNLNDAVFSIVSKNAEKAGQVRLYHAKVKADETKTLREYNQLSKGSMSFHALKEMAVMRKAMLDDRAVDSKLSKLLNKPTRYQTQAEWIEQLFGLRELQGEGNLWFNRGESKGAPLEMMVIPKPHLNLVGNGSDPWEVLDYQFVLNGYTYRWDKEDVLMWKYSNPTQISTTLEHMRGLAPLQAFMVPLQAMNEGDKRIATSNQNGGALGMAYRKDVPKSDSATAAQTIEMRRQFNEIVNSSDMGGKIAFNYGEWGYFNFGTTVEEQQLLEQYGMGFNRLCRVFKTPSGIFNDDAKYSNQPEYKREWIFDKIAPAMHTVRDLLSQRLIPEFALNPERDFIDCDIMSLPEMSRDLKDQVSALKDATWLSENEKRDATGYEKSTNPIMDLTAREYENVGIGSIDDDDNI